MLLTKISNYCFFVVFLEFFIVHSFCDPLLEETEPVTQENSTLIHLENLDDPLHLSSPNNQSKDIFFGNSSVQTNETIIANTTQIKRFACLLENSDLPEDEHTAFQIVNSTTLLSVLKQNQNVTLRSQPAACHIVVFYAPWCPFSILAAPHLNALPRGFPMLQFYAIDAHLHNSLSTIQGVMAIPSLFLFHNGKPAARYNETEYKVDLFANFISRYTGIQPIGVLNRTTADYHGPLPTSVVETTDPWLILAWIVLFLSLVYWFTRSNLFWSLMENVRNTWREAEAQHQHVD